MPLSAHFRVQATVVALVLLTGSGCQSAHSRPEQQSAQKHEGTVRVVVHRNANLIGHVLHDRTGFRIEIDGSDASQLSIGISEKQPVVHPISVLRIRVQLVDDKAIEGEAQRLGPGVSNGGWNEWRYIFPLRRPVTVDDIHSVTISWDGDSYVVVPF